MAGSILGSGKMGSSTARESIETYKELNARVSGKMVSEWLGWMKKSLKSKWKR